MSAASLIDYGVNRKGNRQTRRQWLTDGPPRALVLMIHGIAEHSGRYEEVGAHLAAAGIGAIAIDQRGHGTTEGSKGHVETFEGFLDDVEDQITEMRTVGVPVVLLVEVDAQTCIAFHMNKHFLFAHSRQMRCPLVPGSNCLGT